MGVLLSCRRTIRSSSGGGVRLPHELELVPDLVPVPESPADGVADAEALALVDDLVVGGAQG